MKISSVVFLMGLPFAVLAGSGAEMHSFTLTDGRTISADVVGYNAKLGQVELKLENGRKKKIKPSIFVEADREYIKDWAALAGFRNAARFKIDCSKKKLEQWKEEDSATQTKFKKFAYEVRFENRNEQVLDNLTIDYRIFYEQEENDHATKKVVTHNKVKKGALDLKPLAPREKRSVQTESVVLQEFEFNTGDFYVPDGDPESTSGELKGIWLRISTKGAGGEKVCRDVFEPEDIRGKYQW